MSAAFVIGLCALSFAAGCVVTAIMLRNERTPEPVPRPADDDPPIGETDVRWPPEDYATRPIHRNPVRGIPTALPPPEHSRPTLVVVPNPDPDPNPDPGPVIGVEAGIETEQPVRQDEVRRMRVARDLVALGRGDRPEPGPTRQLSMTGTLSGPVVEPGPVTENPAESKKSSERVDARPVADSPSQAADVPGARTGDQSEPAAAGEAVEPGPAVVEGGPVAIHVPARSDSAVEPRTPRPVDTRRSTSGNA